MISIYKWTIMISTALWVLYWFLPSISSTWYTKDEINLLMWDGWGAKIQPSIINDWLLFFAWLACSIGLFFTVKYTRELFVFLVITTTILSYFLGFRVTTPLDNVLLNTITMADGAIIYMAYFSSVSEHFKK